MPKTKIRHNPMKALGLQDRYPETLRCFPCPICAAKTHLGCRHQRNRSFLRRGRFGCAARDFARFTDAFGKRPDMRIETIIGWQDRFEVSGNSIGEVEFYLRRHRQILRLGIARAHMPVKDLFIAIGPLTFRHDNPIGAFRFEVRFGPTIDVMPSPN